MDQKHHLLKADWRGKGPFKRIASWMNEAATMINNLHFLDGGDVVSTDDFIRLVLHEKDEDAEGAHAAATTSASVGASGGTTTGTFDLDGIDIETNPSNLDVQLANDKIVVKQGFSGIYLISVNVRGNMNHTSYGVNDAAAFVKADGSTLFIWELERASAQIDSSTHGHRIRNSSTQTEFIDASAADVDLTVTYSIDASFGGTVSLFLYQFSVTLLQLTASAQQA